MNSCKPASTPPCILYVTFISISVIVLIGFLPQIFLYNQISWVWNATLVLSSLPVLAVFVSRVAIHLPGNFQVASSLPLKMSHVVTVPVLCSWQSTLPATCHLILNKLGKQMRKLRREDVKCELWGYVTVRAGNVSGPAFLVPVQIHSGTKKESFYCLVLAGKKWKFNHMYTSWIRKRDPGTLSNFKKELLYLYIFLNVF